MGKHDRFDSYCSHHFMNKLKIYILIKETLDVGHAVNCAAHASLMSWLKWKDDKIMQDWLKSFRKVSCKVTNEQFEQAKQFSDFLIVTEDKICNGEVALVFKAREEWPKFFKFLRLYK